MQSSLYFSVLDVVECYIIAMATNISESISKIFKGSNLDVVKCCLCFIFSTIVNEAIRTNSNRKKAQIHKINDFSLLQRFCARKIVAFVV